jgi:hypothetical protein
VRLGRRAKEKERKEGKERKRNKEKRYMTRARASRSFLLTPWFVQFYPKARVLLFGTGIRFLDIAS